MPWGTTNSLLQIRAIELLLAASSQAGQSVSSWDTAVRAFQQTCRQMSVCSCQPFETWLSPQRRLLLNLYSRPAIFLVFVVSKNNGLDFSISSPCRWRWKRIVRKLVFCLTDTVNSLRKKTDWRLGINFRQHRPDGRVIVILYVLLVSMPWCQIVGIALLNMLKWRFSIISHTHYPFIIYDRCCDHIVERWAVFKEAQRQNCAVNNDAGLCLSLLWRNLCANVDRGLRWRVGRFLLQLSFISLSLHFPIERNELIINLLSRDLSQSAFLQITFVHKLNGDHKWKSYQWSCESLVVQVITTTVPQELDQLCQYISRIGVIYSRLNVSPR